MPGYKRKRPSGGRYFRPYSRRAPAPARRRGLSTRRSTGSQAILRSVAPAKLRRTLNYCTKARSNASAGGNSAALFFSANDLYDPDRSLGGHQPMGFDELIPLYDHFVVTHSRINVMAMSESNTVGRDTNQIVSISLRDTTTSTTNIEQSIEIGRTVWGMLGSQDGGASHLSLTHECDVAKFLGRKSLLSDPSCKGSVAGSPTEEVFFEINVANLDGGDPPGVDYLVTIQYDAWFIEPKRLNQS